MTKCNSVSLTSSCGSGSCGWYDDWCCGNSCSGCGTAWNGCGCSNGCGNGCGGCLNGCGSCSNGCGTNACGCGNTCGCSGTWSGCNSCGGCSSCGNCGTWNSCNSCGSCGSWGPWNGWGRSCACACSALWPDAPALQSGGVLVSRIIGAGRLCTRVNDLSLCVQDIPESATAPFALVCVSASGPVDWEFIAQERWRAVIRVTIPLTATIRDCAGCTFTGHSSVTVDVPVRITIPTVDLGRAQVTVQPGCRLLCTTGCSEDGCFTVSLAVLVDVYVARWEANANGDTIPCRPDLPLTLPANFRSCGNCCW